MVEHELMTAREVADLFRVDVKTVYSWVKSGRITNVPTPTGGKRFRTSEVKDLLRAQFGKSF